MRLVVLGVLEQDLVHVSAGILEQLVGVVEDDEGDLAVTQDTQLIRLLHQTKLPLGERHLVEEEKKINIFSAAISSYPVMFHDTDTNFKCNYLTLLTFFALF